MSALILSDPRALAKSGAAIVLFGPVPTHDLAGISVAALLKLLKQVVQAAAQNATGGAAPE
jgi:hypothetical protein